MSLEDSLTSPMQPAIKKSGTLLTCRLSRHDNKTFRLTGHGYTIATVIAIIIVTMFRIFDKLVRNVRLNTLG